MAWEIIAVLFGCFFALMLLGMPIAFAIGISSFIAICWLMPADIAATVVAQKLVAGVDSFALLAIPFFILAGNLMNSGGIARRLIEFAKLIAGGIPGALAHVNILSNMLFGSISGSAVASAAAVGGTMAPLQQRQGYKPEFSAATNVASCTSGLLIPPSNALIVYALVSGGTSLSALFVAGYIPGFVMGLGLMLVAFFSAKKNNYPLVQWPGARQAMNTMWAAVPSLALILIVMGGIIKGVFTATEASAVAVVYAFFLAVVCYREVKLYQLYGIFMRSIITTAMVLFLIGASVSMSWVMAIAELPQVISDAMLAISDNPIILLLLMNLILLAVGVFMDLTPAVLIFTPVFLPVAIRLGMDPVHFGIMLVFNLCIGICTPPVGSALFVGCAVAKLKVQQLVKPLIPYYAVLLALLMLITFIPAISLTLPKLLLSYE